jgi:GT2 family glycosyltransferase
VNEVVTGARTLTWVTPVFEPLVDHFEACVRSVLAQTREDWGWSISVSGAVSPGLRSVLDRLDGDQRVSVAVDASRLGISESTNRAISMVSTEYVGMLDQDDVLMPAATETIVAALQADRPDVLYTDEAKVSDSGTIFDPFFKPDWSPLRLAHQMYVGHCLVLRTALVRQFGGFDPEFDYSQDYELLLRLTREPRVVTHVGEICYLWRSHAESSASDHAAKPDADGAAMRAISRHLSSDECAVSAFSIHPGVYRLELRGLPRPPVSIVIPTGGLPSRRHDGELPLRLVLESLCRTTAYGPLEIIVVADTAHGHALAMELVARMQDSSARASSWNWIVVDAVRGPGEAFNFSRSVNMGVAASAGELLLLLNDDVEVGQDWWLDHMVSTLHFWGLGAVGPILLERDGRVSQAGIATSGVPMNIARARAGLLASPLSTLLLSREVSAVTGACLLTTRALFEAVGGLSEAFPSSFNDVDFCLKVRALGHGCAVDSAVTLVHSESSSRDAAVTGDEVRRFFALWQHELHRDRYYPAILRIWDPTKQDWSATFEPRAEWRKFAYERSAAGLPVESVEGYLDANPDLRAWAADHGATASEAIERHIRSEGFAEGRSVLRATKRAWPLEGEVSELTEESFDEARYLDANPDVRRFVERSILTSGRRHWLEFGRDEGRRQSEAPPTWLSQLLNGQDDSVHAK